MIDNLKKEVIKQIIHKTISAKKFLVDRIQLYISLCDIGKLSTPRKTIFSKEYIAKFKNIKFTPKYKKRFKAPTGQYIIAELLDSVFLLNFSSFEYWMLENFKLIYEADPMLIYENVPKQDRKIKARYVHEAKVLSDIWEKVIYDHVSGLGYGGMEKLLVRFLKMVHINNKKLSSLTGDINEISLLRNVLVHNNKKIDYSYKEKSGKHCRYEIKDNFEVTEDILIESTDILLYFMQTTQKCLEKTL
jgi:hypothetical protein